GAYHPVMRSEPLGDFVEIAAAAGQAMYADQDLIAVRVSPFPISHAMDARRACATYEFETRFKHGGPYGCLVSVLFKAGQEWASKMVNRFTPGEQVYSLRQCLGYAWRWASTSRPSTRDRTIIAPCWSVRQNRAPALCQRRCTIGCGWPYRFHR